jgi:enoyl-CoA hydratase/carnithine racemase
MSNEIETSDPERVSLRIDSGVAVVRFERSDKRNALDGRQFLAIAAVGEQLKARPDARVVVLTGSGASFCAGLDFSGFAAMVDGGMEEAGSDGSPGRLTDSGLTHLGQQICWVWQELEVPVVAALHGHALGGGLQIALGADIRIAHPATQLSVREIHWGIIPDMTGTLMLDRLVRPDIARELTFTGRVLDAEEGHRLGLVTSLSETPLEEAMVLAGEIASRNPEAVRAAKRLLTRRAHDGFAEQFAAERGEIAALIGRPNQVEAITANLESRPPVFSD